MGKIWRSINDKPVLVIRTYGNARLRLRSDFPGTRSCAVRTSAIPLRQAATGRAPEDTNANRFTPALSDRAGVTRALEKDRHAFHRGFDPFFPGRFHQFLEVFLILPGAGVGNEFVIFRAGFLPGPANLFRSPGWATVRPLQAGVAVNCRHSSVGRAADL